MFDLSGFIKISVTNATELANAKLKYIYDWRENWKRNKIAEIHKNREWWMKYLWWLKPLTDDQAAKILFETNWLDYQWAEEHKSKQVLLLCKHSEDNYVYLMPELLGAITH